MPWPSPGAAAALAGVAVAAGLWLAAPARCEGYEDGDDDAGTIFVSVASYRDRECNNTIAEMFSKAANPGRVYVGVCEQNSGDGKEVCVPGAGFEHHARVRRVSIPHGEAKGPTYARHLAAGLYRGEKYFCQIDSHTRFARGWDVAAIADLRKCPSAKPLLTHYPHEFKYYGTEEAAELMPTLCKSSFNDKGILNFEAVLLPRVDEPRRVPFVAGGFVFAPGRVVDEVPFDPNLPHLFVGEEILWAARAWTAGWDFFTPTRNHVFHYYERANEPKFWDDAKADTSAQVAASEARVLAILAGDGRDGAPAPGQTYGLGTARTIDGYWKFAAVDPRTRASDSAARFCK